MKLAVIILGVLSCVSFGLTFWRWVVSMRFPLHRRGVAPPSLPGCTLLKPLKGCDDETKLCLRTWLSQEYPGAVQILFGVAAADDPVCPLVRELLAEFPGVEAQLVICGAALGVNGKVSTLRQLEPLIRHPLVVVSDADVRAPQDFLANLIPPFADPGIGLVNCFYRVTNAGTAAMRWEATGINADFWSSVLQAQSLKAVDFALGAVMALRVEDLRKIGGFAELADYLADDYHLGQQIAGLGKRIVFSPLVVDCHESPVNWRKAWVHQKRWARTIRFCQPFPFFCSVLDNATFWPLCWLVASGPLVPIPIAAACAFFFLFRIITALELEGRLTRVRIHWAWFWLVPVKDLLHIGVWAAAFAGNHIVWRGHRYRVLPGGRLQCVPERPAPAGRAPAEALVALPQQAQSDGRFTGWQADFSLTVDPAVPIKGSKENL